MTEPNDLKGELDRLLNSGASELEFGDMCREFIGRHGARLKRALEIAEKLEDSRITDLTIQEQRPLQNDVHRVYFRAGLLACREHMARFVEPKSPEIAASIRANWWSALSADPGAPRRLNWDEVADGGEDGPWNARTLDVSTEALPVAEMFLIAAEKEANEIAARASENKTP